MHHHLRFSVFWKAPGKNPFSATLFGMNIPHIFFGSFTLKLLFVFTTIFSLFVSVSSIDIFFPILLPIFLSTLPFFLLKFFSVTCLHFNIPVRNLFLLFYFSSLFLFLEILWFFIILFSLWHFISRFSFRENSVFHSRFLFI